MAKWSGKDKISIRGEQEGMETKEETKREALRSKLKRLEEEQEENGVSDKEDIGRRGGRG